jgi:hypothetical protein
MGNPENSPPARPPRLPEDARWDPKDPGFEWVAGGLDDEGRRHGAYRSWTRDGVLHGESNYVHGKVHGKNLNFHPDGTVASEADWVMGLILDSVFYRSDAPTTEPFAQAGPNVWSVRYYTRDGKTNYTIRYFLRDGTECGPDGNVLPPRPANVSADARWFPEMERWVEGAIERGTNHQVGAWRWWSRDGVLRHEEMRDSSGTPTMIAQYEPDGTLKKQTTRGSDGEQRDYYFDNGQLSTRYREDAKGRQVYKGSWLRDGELDEECTRTFASEASGGDTLASVTERGRGGALRFEARREGAELACVLYHGDGKTIAATGMIGADKLAGTWRIFDESGALRREVDATPLAIEQRPTAQGLAWELGHVLYASDEPTLATPPQLAGVDDEPWGDTAGCFDEHVEAFPRLLRGLASTDPLIRQYCLGAIESEIEHQGSTYPATARVIPWLARLLENDNVDRSRLLEVLRQAAENVAPYVGEVKDLDVDDPDRVAIEGTHEAIGKAWPDVFARFASASLEERRIILGLAKLAPGAKDSILEVARTDAEPTMRACAVDSLVAMKGCEYADVMPCLADKDPLVRTATAIALSLEHGPATPREVVAALREGLHIYKDVADRFAELPYVDGHVLAYLALAAGAVRSSDARSLAQALCERIDEVDGRSAVTYGQGLLALAFGRGDKPFAKRFVEILDALATSKQFWVFDVSARELLGTWNLPCGRDELAQLVDQLKANAEPETWLHAKMHRA